MRKAVITLLLACSALMAGTAQKVALKNNLGYDALLTPNAALEIALGKRVTLDLYGGANFFLYSRNPKDKNYTTKKWSHWLAQPELRLWTCEVFNGWFFGAHAHGGLINLGGYNIPLFILENKDNVMQDHRYEAAFLGGGLSVGYHWLIAPRFSMEFSLGGGYARIWYDKYPCVECGEKMGSGQANYLGPTKATISLVWMLK